MLLTRCRRCVLYGNIPGSVRRENYYPRFLRLIGPPCASAGPGEAGTDILLLHCHVQVRARLLRVLCPLLQVVFQVLVEEHLLQMQLHSLLVLCVGRGGGSVVTRE